MDEKEKITGMSDEEMEEMAEFAARIFDKLYKPGSSMTPRDAFIFGFLRGREFTLHQLGAFEDEEDLDMEPPEIIKQYMRFNSINEN